jgi:PA14 domain/GDSL-like Lipase/Acylhydrolase family
LEQSSGGSNPLFRTIDKHTERRGLGADCAATSAESPASTSALYSTHSAEEDFLEPERQFYEIDGATMRYLTRILLVLILIVPILSVWPQRGMTTKFYPNRNWVGPVVVRVERQINLGFMTEASASLPQQDFSVEWSGWLRIDRDGPYVFNLRSDDSSTLELDGRLVVDAGGVAFPTTRSTTIAMTRGLHQMRLRFVQTDGTYQFYANWTPPGEADLAAFQTQQLFVEHQPAVIVFLTRHVLLLWALCWFAFALMVAARIAHSVREMASAERRRFARRLTLALASTIVALLVAEGVVRLAHYVREDRRPLEVQLRGAQAPSSMQSLRLGEIVQPSRYAGIVYELKPNVRGQFMGQPLVINSQGLRDYEYTRGKQPNTFRIVGVGDSSLFGWGVAIEDSGLKVLERRLDEKFRARKFEVVNFAVPGYNTAMESETFVQRCLEYAPDLVLLNFNTNDYDVPQFMRVPNDLATLRRSYLFDWAYSVYDGVMAVEREPLGVFNFRHRTIAERQAARLDEDPALPDEYRYMVGAKGVVRALERLAAAARTRAIPLVVFDVKPQPGFDPKYVRDELRDGQRELLERESRRLGFYFLNTYPYFMNYLKQHPDASFAVSAADGHPNTLAHSINAQALFDYLVAHQLLPSDTPSKDDH